MKNQFNHKYYYLFSLVICLIWLSLGKSFYNNYAPFIWFVNFPIFAFIDYKTLAAFSHKLRLKEPKLFNKHEIGFGFFKNDMINRLNLFHNPDFESLTDKELINSYRLAKRSLIYLFLCFVSFGVSGILTIFIH